MKRYWIAEDFRGHGYWGESPNIAKAVERFGEEAVAISFRERRAEHALILYPGMKFHITANGAKMEIQYDLRLRKWIYLEGEHRCLSSLSRETISNLLFYSREMLHNRKEETL